MYILHYHIHTSINKSKTKVLKIEKLLKKALRILSIKDTKTSF